MMKIIELGPTEIAWLHAAVAGAHVDDRRVRVAIEGDEFKWKIGEGVWTYGMGHIDPDSDLAYARRQGEA